MQARNAAAARYKKEHARKEEEERAAAQRGGGYAQAEYAASALEAEREREKKRQEASGFAKMMRLGKRTLDLLGVTYAMQRMDEYNASLKFRPSAYVTADELEYTKENERLWYPYLRYVVEPCQRLQDTKHFTYVVNFTIMVAVILVGVATYVDDPPNDTWIGFADAVHLPLAYIGARAAPIECA